MLCCIFGFLKVFWPLLLNLPLLWHVSFLVVPQNIVMILLWEIFLFSFFTFYMELYLTLELQCLAVGTMDLPLIEFSHLSSGTALST